MMSRGAAERGGRTDTLADDGADVESKQIVATNIDEERPAPPPPLRRTSGRAENKRTPLLQR